jgi:membrane associated rhomboid family serine protease
LFPFIDTAPRASPPVLVLALIGINTLVFLWMETLPAGTLEQVLLHAALIPIRYTEPLVARQYGLDPSNWWPLLTNTFMHGGWLHLILNMWFLWIFGPAMEARFGRLGFTALYLCGGGSRRARYTFSRIRTRRRRCWVPPARSRRCSAPMRSPTRERG